MKILILNTHDIAGGAARAAHRLHRALRSHGVDSTMLVQFKSGDDHSVIGPQRKSSKIAAIMRQLLDSLASTLCRKEKHAAFSLAFWPNGRLLRTIARLNPDIVHLHWIAAGFVPIEDLPAIRQPIIWTLHDMWPFTGGCHYDTGCGRYRHGCGRCPVLGSRRRQDLSSWTFQRKYRAYSRLRHLTVVGLSRWIADSAKASPLLGARRVVHLPNPIDTKRYHQVDKTTARRLWKLPLDKKLILFGAPRATSDPRKGWKELRNCISLLKLNDAEFVLFGAGRPDNVPDLGIAGHYVGKLNDDVSMVTLYSACDVLVMPSRQENLSNVILESLSCGTPVIAFRVGGNGDMVQHRLNGYLAEPFDLADMAKGIEWALEDQARWQALRWNARQKTERDFDSRPVAAQYLDLYQMVLEEKASISVMGG
jgi:glycosyltransferase involved in cell wall biosynthesis